MSDLVKAGVEIRLECGSACLPLIRLLVADLLAVISVGDGGLAGLASATLVEGDGGGDATHAVDLTVDACSVAESRVCVSASG